MYSTNFKELIQQFKNDTSGTHFIGFGNPSSKVLIVGKEVATNLLSDNPLEQQNLISYNRNIEDWENNTDKNICQDDVPKWEFDPNLKLSQVNNNPLFAFKGSIAKKTSDTWKKYQKLYDLIFNGKINTNTEFRLRHFIKLFFYTIFVFFYKFI